MKEVRKSSPVDTHLRAMGAISGGAGGSVESPPSPSTPLPPPPPPPPPYPHPSPTPPPPRIHRRRPPPVPLPSLTPWPPRPDACTVGTVDGLAPARLWSRGRTTPPSGYPPPGKSASRGKAASPLGLAEWAGGRGGIKFTRQEIESCPGL